MSSIGRIPQGMKDMSSRDDTKARISFIPRTLECNTSHQPDRAMYQEPWRQFREQSRAPQDRYSYRWKERPVQYEGYAPTNVLGPRAPRNFEPETTTSHGDAKG